MPSLPIEAAATVVLWHDLLLEMNTAIQVEFSGLHTWARPGGRLPPPHPPQRRKEPALRGCCDYSERISRLPGVRAACIFGYETAML